MDAHKIFEIRQRKYLRTFTPSQHAVEHMKLRATRLRLVTISPELEKWADPAPRRLHPSIPRGPIRIADRTRKERLVMWLVKAGAMCAVGAWAWWLL